jgi:hypothetical protein
MENTNILKQMNDILNYEMAERHSYFQMKYFIVNKEPTTQSKMWQCLREIKSRYESLQALDLEIDESKDNLELIDININKMIAIYDKKVSMGKPSDSLKISEIKLRKAKRQRVMADKNIETLVKKKKNLEEEANFFVLSFRNLEVVEPLKDYDDLESQKQYWGEKLLQKINLKMLLQSQVDTELIETVLALPDDIPIKGQTVKNLDSMHKKMIQMKNQAEQAISQKQELNGN